MSIRAKLFLFAGCAWIVLSAIAVFWNLSVGWDCACRYAPMAEAFARGDWTWAFHPRFGVLWPVVAGSVVWVTGMDGVAACQVVASGFLAFSLVPLWIVAKDLFDRGIAWATVTIALLADYNPRLACAGMRDNVKCLAFSLLAYGALRKKAGVFSAGTALLALTFSYGYFVAATMTAGWCVVFLWKRDIRRCVWPVLSFVVSTVATSFMVHAYTGVFVPVPHLIPLLRAKGLVP